VPRAGSPYGGVYHRQRRALLASAQDAGGVDVDTASRRSGHTPEVLLRDYVQGSDDKALATSVTLADRLIDQGMPIGELRAGS
jgi:hypothetical protein